ncbi:unnamed protein product [Malus baccata var. baccata]
MPLWLSKLKNMEILCMRCSRIIGQIPRSLGTLPKLLFLSLAGNQISGEIPKELYGLPRLLHEPTTTQVVFYIDLPMFSPADLNCLIPTEIGQLHLVHNLDLRGNYFSGNIPEQLSNLNNLENLHLSMNHLSGNIPLSLASFNFLKYFNVSYNNLEGPIPTSTQLQSFNASAFEGNTKLCGSPLPNERLPIKGIDGNSKNNQGVGNEHEFPWLYIFTILGFIVGFWGVFDNVQDRFYVMITVRMTMMKRRLRGNYIKGGSKSNIAIIHPDLGIGIFPVTIYGAFLPRHIFYRLHALCGYIRCLSIALCKLFTWPSFDVILADQVSVVIPLLRLKKATKVFAPISCELLSGFVLGLIPTSTQLQSFDASAFEENSKLCGPPLQNECLPIKGIDADSKNNLEG